MKRTEGGEMTPVTSSTAAAVEVLEANQKELARGTSALAIALAGAQSEFPAIKMDSRVKVRTKSGSEYEFEYASLDAILSAVRPVLNKHRLAVTQILTGDSLRTSLLHSGGGQIEGEVRLPFSADMTCQERGSVISYFRRYALTCILGVVAEADDDANAADRNHVQRMARPMGEKPATPPAGATPAGNKTLPTATPAATVTAPASNRGEPPTGHLPSDLALSEGQFEAVVQGVSKKEGTNKAGKPYTRYGITFFGVTGILGTFHDDEGTLATECAASGKRVEVAWKRDGKFLTITGLMPVLRKDAADAAKGKKNDDLPF